MFTASTDNHSISTPLEMIHKYVNYKYSLAYTGVQDGQVPSDTPGCTERVDTPGCTGWADTPGCTGRADTPGCTVRADTPGCKININAKS